MRSKAKRLRTAAAVLALVLAAPGTMWADVITVRSETAGDPPRTSAEGAGSCEARRSDSVPRRLSWPLCSRPRVLCGRTSSRSDLKPRVILRERRQRGQAHAKQGEATPYRGGCPGPCARGPGYYVGGRHHGPI